MKNPITAFIDKKLQRFDPVWQAENGKGGLRSRFYDKTGIAKYREWRGVHDTLSDYLAWLNNLKSMGLMVASAPIPVLKGIWEYRWMGSYLGTFAFIDRLYEGYRGPSLKIAHLHMHAIVQSLTKKIALVLSNDKRLGGGPLSDRMVPMDEVLALVALDLSGRPYLVYDVPAPVSYIRELDVALFGEFFHIVRRKYLSWCSIFF